MRGKRPQSSVPPPLAFLAWSSVGGRSSEIATALGGEARCFFALGHLPRWTAPFRWLLNGTQMLVYLVRRRPRALVVTNPPIFAGLLGWLYAKSADLPLALDSHPGSFGLKGDRVASFLLPVHRWLVRQVSVTLVTCDELAAVVLEWGGRPLILHEAEPTWHTSPAAPVGAPARVLVTGTFDPDEPVEAILAAAELLPAVRFALTGHTRRAGRVVRGALPDNVELLGFLRGEQYVAALNDADVVLALTTEPTSVMRAACEAVWAQRVLVASDTPSLRRYFPAAVHVDHDPAALAAGIMDAIRDHPRLSDQAFAARADQLRRTREQVRELRSALQLDGGRPVHAKLNAGMKSPLVSFGSNPNGGSACDS